MKSFLILLITTTLHCQSHAVKNEKVLVIVDEPSRVETHSIFIEQLSSLGLETTIKSADDPSLTLKKYGAFIYDHIVLLAPSLEEFSGSTTPETLIEFVDAGGNLMLTADTHTGDAVRELASEVGVEIDESGNSVIDHFNFDLKDEGLHTLITTSPENLVKSEYIVGQGSGPCLYQGTGLATDSANPLVINVLTASSSAYSHNPQEMIKDYPHAVGKNTVLIAGLQARNNARVLVFGSIQFLSDEFMTGKIEATGKVAGNLQVATDLARWCFKQSGVIRIDRIEHKSLSSDTKLPGFYTIREECEFSVKISELVKGQWVPFQANDVQMEFVRIDPFVRKTMVGDKKSGVFKAKFTIPDVYGVFKFVINHSRLGVTSVYSSNQISVHPLRHNQYERFIYSAYPYYASAFSMMAGVFVFAFVFLHHKDDEGKPKKE
eukprot:TRINITY_DN148_c0_g1_i5.p1 TRINITY_DN148_c0_g1~~TRINITY_DN148_c0_g1_i5.p1  ORF type:complete len:434 (-),score=65.84 TRINITY_DN148_c0_g1_i5:357-1658(-)